LIVETDQRSLVALNDDLIGVAAASVQCQFVFCAVDRRDLLRTRSLECHAEMAEHEQDGTERNRLALPEIPVGQRAADDRHHIDQRGIGAVDQRGFFVRKQEMLRQVDDEKAAHPVIGKALPHLGQEQDKQAFRVTEKAGVSRNGIRCRYWNVCHSGPPQARCSLWRAISA